jgi:tetratricopeptide (TPR) repeat protein
MVLARLPVRGRVIVSAMLVAALGARTVTYAARWNDRLSFYERSAAENPRAARLHVLLAREWIDQRKWEAARKTIEEGLTYAPDYWKLWSLSARVATAQGRWEDAQRDVDRAWQLDPFILDLLGVVDRIEAHRAATRPATGG